MKNNLTQKERLLKVLNNEIVDRPPVICPGGMMNSAVTEVVKDLKNSHNVELKEMVEAAKLVHEKTGFENFGVPFCMTSEAEILGVKVELGDKDKEPRVTEYNSSSMLDIIDKYDIYPLKEKRMKTVIMAISELRNEQIPVIGNITGHISTASSVVDPNLFFKNLIKKPEESYKFLSYINNYLIDYAKEMLIAGADVIAVSDPTATGEILGKRIFDKFAVPFYKEFVNALSEHNIPVIFHMCGNAKLVVESMDEVGFSALSFDSIVNMKETKKKITTKLMGNVNTQSLDNGDENIIKALTKHSINSGVDIVAPACGLGMGTKISSIKCMTDYVKEK